MTALLLCCILAPTPDRIAPSPHAALPVVEQPVKLKAAKNCRYFLHGEEVQEPEFVRRAQRVTLIIVDEHTNEVLRMEAD